MEVSQTKFAIINSSDLSKYGRMDAQFHIARKSLDGLDEKLEREISADEAHALSLELFEALSVDLQAIVEPLTREQKASKEGRLRAIKEYPHIALTLFQKNKENIQNIYDERFEEATRRKKNFLDTLSKI